MNLYRNSFIYDLSSLDVTQPLDVWFGTPMGAEVNLTLEANAVELTEQVAAQFAALPLVSPDPCDTTTGTIIALESVVIITTYSPFPLQGGMFIENGSNAVVDADITKAIYGPMNIGQQVGGAASYADALREGLNQFTLNPTEIAIAVNTDASGDETEPGAGDEELPPA